MQYFLGKSTPYHYLQLEFHFKYDHMMGQKESSKAKNKKMNIV